MAKNHYQEHEVIKLIVNEVEEARDTLQIVKQLHHALPIKNFNDLKKATSQTGKLKFRNASVDISIFEDWIPDMIFPIDDLVTLVERVIHVVRLIPPHVGFDPNNPENVKRYTRRLAGLGVPPNGFPQNTLGALHAIRRSGHSISMDSHRHRPEQIDTENVEK